MHRGWSLVDQVADHEAGKLVLNALPDAGLVTDPVDDAPSRLPLAQHHVRPIRSRFVEAMLEESLSSLHGGRLGDTLHVAFGVRFRLHSAPLPRITSTGMRLAACPLPVWRYLTLAGFEKPANPRNCLCLNGSRMLHTSHSPAGSPTLGHAPDRSR